MKKLYFILILVLMSSLLFAEENYQFSFDTGKAGNLFYFGEKLSGKIIYSDPSAKITGTLEYYDSFGNLVKTSDISFKKECKLNLPNKKGCVDIKYNFTVNDSEKADGVFSYGTIPNNQKIMGGLNSYFGVNTHFNQAWQPFVGEIVKRCGISWIRDGEAFYEDDRAFRVAKENGLNYMPCWTGGIREPAFEFLKKEMADGNNLEGKFDFTPYLGGVREYIRKYGDRIDFYNVMNEQNYSGWREAFGGEEYYGPWLNCFIQWAKQVSDIIREMDPTAKIVWDDANFSNIYDYEKYGIDKEIDYISIHPYAAKPEHTYRRFIADTQKTEDISVDEMFERFFDFNKKFNRNWRAMEGENGFPAFVKSPEDPTGYVSRTADIQAAHMVRMYIMHLSCGAERIIWYDFKDDGTNGGFAEHRFGMIKFDGQPKPSVCAFANLINVIEGGKIIGRNKDYKDPVYAYDFINRYGVKGAVCWAEPNPIIHDYKGKIISKTDFSQKTEIKTDKSYLKIKDMFGNESVIWAKNGKITVNLTEYPVYVLGL